MSEPTATRAPEPDGPTVTSAVPTAPEPSEEPPAAPPGYELHTLIGSGGMGAVYRAHDAALARDVAIKFLHARFAPDSVTAWRFTEEARITARLQHPGIPPVHQVGLTPDGRPFLAMKLIKGDTLDELLKSRKSPADDRGRFVGIFEQVAQAVGFAHSRRIIHRDLKPANVMVGGFAEVQVMDWGLAKELGEDKPGEPVRSDETLSIELRAGREGMEATQAGSLLGTPAYMAPEQAVGAIDQINERSDVFGLGALLCVILTGKPPFVAESAESARVLAARGKLDDAFARLGACGAEPELVALAKKCMAPEAGDRPANAGEVANAVAAFRADAERRARQAEMDLARAEVKAAEVRKRKRVQRALAATFLGLVAVAATAAWWIDSERKTHRAEQQSEELRRETARQVRDAEVTSRQLATDRDVTAALNEVYVLIEQGQKSAEDTERWGLTLVAAKSALKRAEGLLAAGEPTDALRGRVAQATIDLDRSERNRVLLAELDRITEENDVRFLLPFGLSRRPSDRYAAAFRAHGIDLLNVPSPVAAAWLKAHPFRQRLTYAIRNWQFSLPAVDPSFRLSGVASQAAPAMAAVGGEMGSAAVRLTPTLRDRLRSLADAVTEDQFSREWWSAVQTKDHETLKSLLSRPEFGRLSSGELSSLADGLLDTSGRIETRGTNEALLTDLLRAAYERFPGDFWVNFRLASHSQAGRPGADAAARGAESLRHLNAAVAARPRSVMARVGLAAELWDHHKKDPTALRIIRGAAEIDPSSPWPHLFLGFIAAESGNWADLRTSLVQAVRADPDMAFLIAASMLPAPRPFGAGNAQPENEVRSLIDSLVSAAPDHPGGYQIRGGYRMARMDYRGAMADFRKAKALQRPDFLFGALVSMQIDTLERMAQYEQKLPAVLRGELKLTGSEYETLAEYCAGFEQKFALAARFAGEALASEAKAYLGVANVAKFAGWAVRASRGEGADGPGLTALERAGLRRQALAWLRQAKAQEDKQNTFLAYYLRQNEDLAHVRDPAELAKLPPEERVAWEKFWADVPSQAVPTVRSESAPAPRAKP